MATVMTMKAFLTAVSEGKVTDEIKAFATDRLEKEVARLESRKTSDAALAKIAADEALVAKFFEVVTPETSMTASEIAKLLDVTTSKATVIAKKAIETGRVKAGSGKGSGGRAVKTYTVIA